MSSTFTKGTGNFGQVRAKSLRLPTPSGNSGLFINGTLVTATAADLNAITSVGETVKVAKVALGHVDTAGGIFAWVTPAACMISRVFVNVTVVAAAACSLDVGYQATGATTLSDNLIDGIDVHSATGLFDNTSGDATNAKTFQLAAAGKWVTGSVVAGGASASLVGFAYIHYVLV